MDTRTKEISVFIDESGSFESNPESSHYYMVCMVFHNQDNDLTNDFQKLGNSLLGMGLSPSERVFFGGAKNLKKNYLKILDRKNHA